ncbi:MAG: GNAT family N-acetyltransferase [Proteobacteria bacterium]|nr:GNAT family N-acetyltransferase [Pseudomonadota bacterium]
MKYSLKLVDDPKAIATEWRALQKKGATLCFQNYDWVSSWYESVSSARRLNARFAVVIIEAQVSMILPVEVQRGAGGKVLSMAGSPLCDLSAPSFDPEVFNSSNSSSVASIFKEIFGLISASLAFDYVLFRNVPQYVRSYINPLFLFQSSDVRGYSYGRNLERDWDGFSAAAISKKMAADSRRCLKRLDEIDAVSFVQSSTADDINWILSEKDRSLRETGELSVFQDSEVLRFYSILASRNVLAHVSILKIGNTRIAGHIGAEFDGVYYYLVPVVEASVGRKYSAGRLLLEWLFQQRIAALDLYFDFTIGAESYKLTWCNQKIELVNVVLGNSMYGSILVFGYQMMRCVLALKHRAATYFVRP